MNSSNYIFVLLLFLVVSLYGEEEYFEWLNNNINDPGFSLILRKAVQETSSLNELSRLVETFGNHAELSAEDRVFLWQRWAQVAELRGNFTQARHAYLTAYKINSEPRLLLEAVYAAFELGEYTQVIREITVLVDTEVGQEAEIVYVRTLELLDRSEEAWQLLQSLLERNTSAALLYYAWELATRHQENAEEYALRLSRDFPNTPEAQLLEERRKGVQGRLQDIPLPSRLLKTSKPQTTDEVSVEAETFPYGMQIGVFSNKKNADNFSQNFLEQGFTVRILPYSKEGETLQRVVILNADRIPAQEFIIQLRDKNIEGVLFTDPIR